MPTRGLISKIGIIEIVIIRESDRDKKLTEKSYYRASIAPYSEIWVYLKIGPNRT